MEKIINALARELNIKPKQAEATVQLLDEGNTVPFIARYRKEVTGSLNDEVLRALSERLQYLRNLEERKEQVKSYLGKKVVIGIDRPIGYVHKKENYSLTYEKARMEYTLDIDEETARLTVNNLKAKIKSLGEVNTGSIAEYERLNERYTFLSTQRDDLESSVSSLLSVIEEMDEIMKSKFVETFEKISVEFKNVFKKLFKGGDGVLELTDPEDILNTGIEISALPPGKKLNSIALLSGNLIKNLCVPSLADF